MGVCECTYNCFYAYTFLSLCVCPCIFLYVFVCVFVCVCVRSCMHVYVDAFHWYSLLTYNLYTKFFSAGESTTISRTSLNTDNRWRNLNTSPDTRREKRIAFKQVSKKNWSASTQVELQAVAGAFISTRTVITVTNT